MSEEPTTKVRIDRHALIRALGSAGATGAWVSDQCAPGAGRSAAGETRIRRARKNYNSGSGRPRFPLDKFVEFQRFSAINRPHRRSAHRRCRKHRATLPAYSRGNDPNCLRVPLTATQPKSKAPKRPRGRRSNFERNLARSLGLVLPLAAFFGAAGVIVQAEYTVTLRSPLRVGLQWPIIFVPRTSHDDASEAQADQFGRRLTAYQQYACNKFGSACRVALAIQRAENPRGDCEIYHYNLDGTLDWGYFQINTVHLKRAGVNLRGLLDCRANIDFAYQLYTERDFEPWTTFRSGEYRRFLRNF